MTDSGLWVITTLGLTVLVGLASVVWHLDKLDTKFDRVLESLVHIAESAAVAKDRTERKTG